MRVNPDTQAVFAANERKTIMGEYSTLAMLDQAFGNGAAASWLVTLITNLNIFAGSRSMDDHQVRSLALLLSQEYRDMKYSVMQLFFHRFKCGDFGRFYGKVDPMVITCALKDFAAVCEQKRQQFNNEGFVLRQQEAARRKAEQEKRWDACRQELCDRSRTEGQRKAFASLSFCCFDEEKGVLLLFTTQDEFSLLEGPFLPLLSEVFARHYPKVRLQYKLYAPRKHIETEPIVKQTAMSLRKTNGQDGHLEIQAGLNAAHAIIGNKLHLDKESADKMRDYFRKRYGGTPEDYIKRHQPTHA